MVTKNPTWAQQGRGRVTLDADGSTDDRSNDPPMGKRAGRHHSRESRDLEPTRLKGLNGLNGPDDLADPQPLLPMASTGQPSIASLQAASSSGEVGCFIT